MMLKMVIMYQHDLQLVMFQSTSTRKIQSTHFCLIRFHLLSLTLRQLVHCDGLKYINNK